MTVRPGALLAESADAASDDARMRALPRRLALAVAGLAILLALAHIYWNTFWIVSDKWKAAIHFGGFGLMAFLYLPPLRRWRGDGPRAALAIDIALGLLLVASVAYIRWADTPIYQRGNSLIWSDWLFLGLTLVLVLELARRAAGLIIPVLTVLALAYMLYLGGLLDGMLHFPGWPLDNTLIRAFYNDDGFFGQIAWISSTSVFMFILFGAFLVVSGAGEFIIGFARAVAGKLTGGPGFVAVISSGLMGTISGSAIANTAATGVITIPLMKRSGFPARFAAGVEAAASTGGQLMPPIMGAGAFVMANYTQIPYTQIIAVSALPALLYFLSVAFYVRTTALKHGLRAVDDPQAPPLRTLLRERGLVFILPIATLITLLIAAYTPPYAAGISIVVVIAASWLTPHRMGLTEITQALVIGCRNMMSTAILLVAVGGIVLVINTTAIGNTVSLMLVDWAGGSLLVALVLIALVSLVLGMGLPVVAAYIVVATLGAPALADLITRGEILELIMGGAAPPTLQATLMLAAPDLAALLGQPMSAAQAGEILAAIPPEFYGNVVDETLSMQQATMALLTGHMIVFWLSQDSNVTPPVCLAAFTAAAIARTPQMSTGMAAWKIAKGLYLVPLLMAYQPFLSGDWTSASLIFGIGLVAIYASVGAMEGYLEYRLSIAERILLAVLAVILFWPLAGWIHGVAIAVFLIYLAVHVYRGRLAAGRAAA